MLINNNSNILKKTSSVAIQTTNMDMQTQYNENSNEIKNYNTYSK